MKTKRYVIFKKECGYITAYFYDGTNIRTISKLLNVPYRNIFRYDYLKDMQKWQILNSEYSAYIYFEGKDRILSLAYKDSGKVKPLYFYNELEDLILDYERGII